MGNMMEPNQLAFFVAALSFVGTALLSDENTNAVEPPRKKVGKTSAHGIRVSRETTFITGPLRKNGTVDYAAALNRLAGKGVNSSNNAATLLFPLVSKKRLRNPQRNALLKRTGGKEVDDKTRFVAFDEYVENNKKDEKTSDKLHDNRDIALTRPWRRREFPEIDAWIKANEPALAQIAKASLRRRWFHPLVTPEDKACLVWAALEMPAEMRGFVRCLKARAMRALGERKHEAALNDILTCHRLARLVTQGETIIESLLGYALEFQAFGAGERLISMKGVTVELLDRYQKELEKLPSFRQLAGKYGRAEKFMALDAVQFVAVNGRAGLRTFVESAYQMGVKVPSVPQQVFTVTDWNVALKMVNDAVDRAVKAVSKKNRKERARALAAERTRIRGMTASIGRWTREDFVKQRSTPAGRKLISKRSGHVMVLYLAPTAAEQVVNAEDRAIVRTRLLTIAIALRKRQLRKKPVPRLLKDLKELPTTDPLSGKPFVLRTSKEEIVIYSVGNNGRDEGGRSFQSKPSGDDIRIRLPVQ